MKKVIYAYNPGSESAKLLAQALECRRIRHTRSTFRGSHRVLAINWGSSSLPPEVAKCSVLNQPHAVARAANKTKTFMMLRGHVPTPEWTSSSDVAKGWFDEGFLVVGRRTVTGSGGKGIELMRIARMRTLGAKQEFIPNLPLYTKYFAKHDEYRVHVVRGAVIDFTKKVRREGTPPALVRNTANGYIFARQNVHLPANVGLRCVDAIARLGLDFGACDVAYNRDTGEFVILEVNTAPGIEGTTLTKYKEAFEAYDAM